MAEYQVVGQCAHVSTVTPGGRQTLLLHWGALLPEGVPAEQIKHLLSVKLIKKVGTDGPEVPGAAVPETGVVPSPVAPVLPAPASAGDGDEQRPAGGKAFDDPERVAAREKLPTNGELPDGRAAHAVWVEAAVARGYLYEAAAATEKAELVKLLRG